MTQFQYIITLIILLSLGIINPINAQVSENPELFQTLKRKDSLLFNVGFNECDINQFRNLTTEDLEFYHDKAGILNSKEAFVDVMANGICKKDNPHKPK